MDVANFCWRLCGLIMSVCTFIGTPNVDTLWSISGNWDVVPVDGDSIVLPNFTRIECDIDIEIAGITLASSTIWVNPGNTLTITSPGKAIFNGISNLSIPGNGAVGNLIGDCEFNDTSKHYSGANITGNIVFNDLSVFSFLQAEQNVTTGTVTFNDKSYILSNVIINGFISTPWIRDSQDLISDKPTGEEPQELHLKFSSVPIGGDIIGTGLANY